MDQAQLTLEVKKQICPPNGNPFSNVNMHLLNNSNIPNDLEKAFIYKIILVVIDRLINTGHNGRNQNGSITNIVHFITLVHTDAANSLHGYINP